MDKATLKMLLDGARETKEQGDAETAKHMLEALNAVYTGDEAQALQLLQPALKRDSPNKYAWLMALHLAPDDEARAAAAEWVLALEPDNADALAVREQPGGKAAAPPPFATEPQALELEPLPDDNEQGRRQIGTEENGARVYHDGSYEMMWDCEFCGSKKLLAKTHRFCATCGAPQNADKRYFPPEGEEIAVEDHEYVGADRVCEACQTPNAAAANNCRQCGMPLTEAAAARLVQAQERAAPPPPAAAAGGGGRKGWIFGVLGILIAGGAGFFFWTKEVSVAVVAHAWEREIKIEDYRPRSDQAWCDSMPAGAYSISRKSEVRSHKKIPDGEDCSTRKVDQGDGTYRKEKVCKTRYREEPVYADRCHFTVDRWEYTRSATAGADDRKPHWPKPQLKGSGQACHGCEREANRQGRYFLTLVSSKDKETFRCDVSESLWQSAEPESKWKMEVGAMMGEARCDSIEPLR